MADMATGATNGPTASLGAVHEVFLSQRRLDVDTNFFEAGFTSSQLAGLLVPLRDLGLTLSLVDLYRYPTVRQLSSALLRPVAVPPPWM